MSDLEAWSRARGTVEPSSALRMLVVEDDDDDRGWIVRMLVEAGVSPADITETARLDDAVRLLDAREFDLAIVDWRLPDGSGMDLVRSVRAERHTPIIVITGVERDEQGAFALRHGALDFLPKDDLSARALARACRHAITRSGLEREVVVRRIAEQQAHAATAAALREERCGHERVAALHRLVALLVVARTAAEICAWTVKQLCTLQGVEATSVYLTSGDALHLQHASGFSQQVLDAWAVVALRTETPLASAVRSGSTVLFAGGAGKSHDLTSGESRTPSWLAVPLLGTALPAGVIGVRCTAVPTEDLVAHFEIVAAHVAQALERARRYDESERVARLEDRLLHVIGTEMRGPLAEIAVAARSLAEGSAGPDVPLRLEGACGELAELFEDLRVRARVRNASGSVPATGWTDLVPVVRDAVASVSERADGTEIRMEIDPLVGGTCEPVRTRRIVVNLLRSALRRGAPRAPVTLRLSRIGTGVAVSVHNYGPPIPPVALPSLFDGFGRGADTRLFVVRELAKALGGGVDADSDDSGTTLSVSLPTRPLAAQK